MFGVVAAAAVVTLVISLATGCTVTALLDLLLTDPLPRAKSPAVCGATVAEIVSICCLPVVSVAVPVNVTLKVAKLLIDTLEQSKVWAMLFTVHAPVELLAALRLTFTSPRLPVMCPVEMSSGP